MIGLTLTLFVSHPHSPFFVFCLYVYFVHISLCKIIYLLKKEREKGTSFERIQFKNICYRKLTSHPPRSKQKKRESNKRICNDRKQNKKETYAHFRTRMVDENNFRLFTIQQNAHSFFTEFIICHSTQQQSARRQGKSVKAKGIASNNRRKKKQLVEKERKRKRNHMNRTIGISHNINVYTI